MDDDKKVKFKGSSGEYFRIWIVNLFLSIITLGIYSAWAKVINTKYLYQNLSIDGHRFDYIAKPIQILKGRLIAIFLLISYSVLASYNLTLSMLLAIILLFLFPWIINRSMSFQLRMTTYRNVRFDFEGDYGKSFLYFFLLPFLSIFTLYLTLPLIVKHINEYIINKTKFGDKYFTSNLSTTEFYVAAFKTLGGIIGISIVLGLIFSLTGPIGFIVLFFGYILIITLFTSIWGTIIRNHTYNHTKLLKVATFYSSMEIKPYTYIVFTNVLALIFSLGLAYPWVAIRNIEYLASTLSVETEEGIDSVIDTISKDSSALLDEVAEAFDIEI